MGSACSCDDDNDPVNGGYYSSVSASRRDPNKHKRPPDSLAKFDEAAANNGGDDARFNRNGKFSPKAGITENGFAGDHHHQHQAPPHQLTSSTNNSMGTSAAENNNNQHNKYTNNVNPSDEDDALQSDENRAHRIASKEKHLPGATNNFEALVTNESNAKRRRTLAGNNANAAAADGDKTPEQGCLSFEEIDLTPLPGSVGHQDGMNIDNNNNGENNTMTQNQNQYYSNSSNVSDYVEHRQQQVSGFMMLVKGMPQFVATANAGR